MRTESYYDHTHRPPETRYQSDRTGWWIGAGVGAVTLVTMIVLAVQVFGGAK